jgi:hypothetical protein
VHYTLSPLSPRYYLHIAQRVWVCSTLCSPAVAVDLAQHVLQEASLQVPASSLRKGSMTAQHADNTSVCGPSM